MSMTSLVLEYTLQDLAMMSPSLSNSSPVRHFDLPMLPWMTDVTD
ncbi:MULTISPECIES: hypothetical protein [Neorhizobium]|jgi:hypothetical protein|nr:MULTISPECIES: hypothetical protein [Neorhizobium]